MRTTRARWLTIATALVAICTLSLTACGGSGGGDGDTAVEGRNVSTTTAAVDGRKATTTTVGDDDDEHPTEELQAALDDFGDAIEPADQRRVDALTGGDEEDLIAAIADQRDAYFAFDGDVRKIDAEGDDLEERNDLLAVTADVIANLDEYSGKTGTKAGYESVIYKEVASVNHWRELVGEVVDEWDATYDPGDDMSFPEGYVGAGDRISSLEPSSPDGRPYSSPHSFEVPDGFAGEDGAVTLDVRGPQGVFISTGVANASDEDPTPSQDELEAFTKDYAEASNSKAGGELGDIEEVKVGDLTGYGYTIEGDDFMERDVHFLDEVSGKVVAISLYARSKEQFERWESAFQQAVESFEFAE